MLRAAATAPAATAATTTPAMASAFVALTRLSGALVTGPRLGAEAGGVVSRFWLRWLAVANLFIAAAGDIAGLAG